MPGKDVGVLCTVLARSYSEINGKMLPQPGTSLTSQ